MARITFEDVGMVFPGGTRAIEGVDLVIEDGEFLVLVGPSGSGKSTLLRMLAGLEQITEGKVMIGDRVVNELAPKDRDIAMVFQNYALYPHMSVFDNLAFGLRLRGLPKDEIKSKVEEAALILEIHEFLERKPRALSGGQRQRVAMGRAIVREPSAFLMDEPLSNLDAKLRVQMRTELGRLHARLRTTTVYVTHDQVEAMTLGHRVAVIRKGKLQQVDTPSSLYRNPLNMFVAGFIGSPAMNFVYVDLTEEGGKVKAEFADNVLELAESLLAEHPAIRDYVGREVVMGVRPGHFEDSRVSVAEPGRTLDGKIDVVEVLGEEAFIHFNLPVRCVITPDIEELLADRGEDASSLGEETEITARVSGDVEVNPGDTVKLTVDTRKLLFFDPDTAGRITGQQ